MEGEKFRIWGRVNEKHTKKYYEGKNHKRKFDGG